MLSQLITKLKAQNIHFLFFPGPASLPGDTKVKNLFKLFGLTVPETLKKIARKYVYNLDPDPEKNNDQRGKVLSELTRLLASDVIIFDRFLAGLSDELIYHFAGVLNSIKKGRIVVYFTNSLMVTVLIQDCGIKWKKEKITF